MRGSNRENAAARVRAGARLGRRLAGLAGVLAVLSFEMFQPAGALAQGRGEDVRLNLFLDTEGLVEPDTAEEPDSAEVAKDGKPGPETRDLRKDLGDQWRIDPIFLRRAQTGQPIDSEEELRESLFGIELRRQF